VEVALLVADGPPLVAKGIAWLLDRQVLQGVGVDVSRATVGKLHLWHRQDLGLNLDWLRLNDHAPVFESLLIKEVFGEVLNRLEFLLRVLAA
jgi:hypothetical protein